MNFVIIFHAKFRMIRSKMKTALRDIVFEDTSTMGLEARRIGEGAISCKASMVATFEIRTPKDRYDPDV